MTFTVNSGNRCKGGTGEHFRINVTFQDGPTIDIESTKEEIEAEKPVTREQYEKAVISRVISAMKEQPSGTLNQRFQAITGNTYKV